MLKKQDHKISNDSRTHPIGRKHSWVIGAVYITSIIIITSLLLVNIFQPDKYSNLDIGFSLLALCLVGALVINRYSHRKDSFFNRTTKHSFQEKGLSLQALLNASTETAMLVDKNGTILAINQISAKRLGKSVKELIGLEIYDYLPREIAEYRKTQADKVIESGQPLRFCDERENRIYDNNIYPVFDSEGKVSAIAIYSRDITGSRQTKQKLERSEEQYRILFNTAPIVIFNLSPDGTILEFNPEAGNLIGWDRVGIIGKNYIDLFIPEESRNAVRLDIKNVLDGTPTRNFENPIILPDGSKRLMVWNIDAVHNSLGNATGIVAVGYDATKHKMAENDLLKSEEKLSLVFRSNPCPVIISSLKDNRIIEVNDSFQRLSGYKKSETIGHTAQELNLWHIPEQREYLIKKLKEDGSVSDLEYTYKDKAGNIFIGLLSCETIKIDNEPCMLATFMDITERKKVEEALKESEQKFQNITQNIPGMIYQFRVRNDGSHYFSYISPNAQKIFGLPDDLNSEVYNTFSTIHPEDREQFIKSIAEATKNAADWDQKGRILMPDGKVKWFHGIASPNRVDNKLVYNGILLDITDRKIAEEELRDNESILGSIFRASPVGIGLVINRLIKQVNQKICEMLGYTREELIGQSARMLYPSDEDFEYVGKEKYRQISTGGIGAVETRWQRKDGQIIDVLLSSTPLDQNDLSKGVTFTALDITDRKLAENEIMREKSFSDGLLQSLPGIFYLFGENGVIQRWNRKFEEVTGYSGEEIGLMKAMDFFEGDDQRFVYSKIKEVFEKGQSHVDAVLITKSGNKIPYHFTGTRLIADGEAFLLGVGIDISEHKLAIKALRESEERSRNIIESSPMGMHMYQMEPDNRLIFAGANPAADYIFDVDHNQFIGKTIEEAFPELIESEIPATYKRIASDGGKWYTEKINYEEGTIKGAHEVHAFQTSPGKMTALFFDITERKKVEERFRAAQALLFSSIEQSPAGILIADAPDVKIRIANSAALGIRGESMAPLTDISAEFHPQNWQTFHLDGELYKPEELPLSRAILEGVTSKDVEIIIRRPNGEDRLVSANAAPIRDRDGIIMAGVVVFLDITETRRLQKLETRAQRLQTAGQIAAQVAHDFNNLLGPLMAYPELMRDTLPENHESHALLDSIEQAAQKMADINQQLLTLGRRGHYDLKPININGIILNAVREMGQLPETLACEIDLEDNLMDIMGGSAQIYRVVLNLLHNARDAMQDIGRLIIKTENYYSDDTAMVFGQIPKGEYVKLTITDAGCGIPNEKIDRIFDPFYTSKTADRKRGSGLGLSVVDAVVKDHNGYIDINSKIGEGTSFYLYFPISRETVDKQTFEQILGGDESVLIVDDDEIQRNVSMRILTKLGYNVNIASSGEEAIKLNRKQPHDIIVLDMVMPPGIDGTETYRQMLEFNPDQKAIIISGYSETERVIEAKNLGAGEFVKKPLTSYAIATALRNELDKIAEARTDR